MYTQFKFNTWIWITRNVGIFCVPVSAIRILWRGGGGRIAYSSIWIHISFDCIPFHIPCQTFIISKNHLIFPSQNFNRIVYSRCEQDHRPCTTWWVCMMRSSSWWYHQLCTMRSWWWWWWTSSSLYCGWAAMWSSLGCSSSGQWVSTPLFIYLTSISLLLALAEGLPLLQTAHFTFCLNRRSAPRPPTFFSSWDVRKSPKTVFRPSSFLREAFHKIRKCTINVSGCLKLSEWVQQLVLT